ncbi:MAG TPA: polyribonucleotide nucleotidyltransferase, partial [Rhizomicrobium sp.]|nr:polyribonucleotide nucleotidyltransferase [Rhizomicrobium sp.]
MFNIVREEIEWAGRKLTLETGRMARQADGAVLATYGETVVLANVVSAKAPKEGVDFFPLTVNYQERYYAAGKIPGGYFKRERAPTERETLISRLIDRPIRPLFADGYRNDTMVVAQVLSHDLENDPDIVAMVAASAALTISGIPFMGPIGAARVGYIDGEYKLNPQMDEMSSSALDLVVAGTADAVLMVESEAKELPEDVMLGAVMAGHRGFQPVIDAIIRLAEKSAKEPRPVPEDVHAALREKLKSEAGKELSAAFQIAEKHVRRDAIAAVRERLAAQYVGEGEGKISGNAFSNLMHDVEAHVMRNAVLDTKRRIDGRD